MRIIREEALGTNTVEKFSECTAVIRNGAGLHFTKFGVFKSKVIRVRFPELPEWHHDIPSGFSYCSIIHDNTWNINCEIITAESWRRSEYDLLSFHRPLFKHFFWAMNSNFSGGAILKLWLQEYALFCTQYSLYNCLCCMRNFFKKLVVSSANQNQLEGMIISVPTLNHVYPLTPLAKTSCELVYYHSIWRPFMQLLLHYLFL